MTECSGKRFPSRAERERASDLAWVSENLHVFCPLADRGYAENGRCAIVVDPTWRPTGEGYHFAYFPRALVEQTGDQDTQRMVRQYDPSWEVVTVLLKTHDRASVYRLGVVGRKPER